MNYLEIVHEALNAAQNAIAPIFRGTNISTFLGHGAHGDPTYTIDRVAEDAILNVIKQNIPDAYVVTEEKGQIGNESNEITVLIDPIDGSTNAIHHIPFFSSAIAIAEGKGFRDIVAAGVIDLIHQDVFVGGERGGILLNGISVNPSSNTNLSSAYIFVNPRASSETETWKQDLGRLLVETRYPRCLGSSALETAYVADGRADAFIETRHRLRPFDCVPSMYLILKAGGFVELLGTRVDDLDLRRKVRLGLIAAGNKELGDKIMSILT